MASNVNGGTIIPTFSIFVNSQLCQNSSIVDTIDTTAIPQIGRGKNSRFLYKFNKKPVFTEESRISIGNISIPYSWYNLTEAFGNNVISYQFCAKQRRITIPDGFYSEYTLNQLLQSVMYKCGDYLLNGDGQVVYFLEIVVNIIRYRLQFNSFSQSYGPLPTGYTVPSNWNSTVNDDVVSTTDVTTLNSYVPISSGTLSALQPATLAAAMVGSTPGTFPGGILKVQDNSVSKVGQAHSLYEFLGLISTNSGILPSSVSLNSPSTQSQLGDVAPYQVTVENLFLQISQVRNEFSCPQQTVTTMALSAIQLNTTFGNNITLDQFFTTWMPLHLGPADSIQIAITDQAGRDVYLEDPRTSMELIITHVKLV